MDQLTRDFFSHTFPGFHDPFVIDKNPLKTNLPIVSLDLNIDYQQLYELATQLPRHTGVRPTYPYEENCPRHVKWEVDILWNDGTVEPWITDIYYRKTVPKHPAISPNEISTEIKKILDSTGLGIKACLLSVFGARGYFRPHRDIKVIDDPLSYFWIPLNQPQGSRIKFYPYGDMNIQLGHIYLFNQENYTHAVLNDSDDDRYVLLGYLEGCQSAEINNKIVSSILQQYPSVIC